MESYVGEIRMFAGNFAPQNWHLCDGSLLSVSQYQTLFSLIGTTYGGDGVSTFGLPDLRGRTPIGVGLGTGLSNRTLGQKGGKVSVTLTSDQMPSHTHPVMASKDNAASTTPGNTLILGTTTSGTLYTTVSGGGTAFSFNALALTNSGQGQAHKNVMPTYGLNFIISLSGLYPTFQ